MKLLDWAKENKKKELTVKVVSNNGKDNLRVIGFEKAKKIYNRLLSDKSKQKMLKRFKDGKKIKLSTILKEIK